MKWMMMLAALALPVMAVNAAPKKAPAAPKTGALAELHVQGNKLVNSKGRVVRLQGVNVASLEWSNEGDHMMDSVKAAVTGWKSNILRIPMAQDRWFGLAQYQDDGGAAYRALVDRVVEDANARGAYVLLDLHWSDMTRWGKDIGQHKMPDDNSVVFWIAVASHFANRPGVLFDLYNEPRDVSWDVWKNGGEVTEQNGAKQDVTYHTPGMQKLLEIVRGTGAHNVAIIGGLDWAYDLTGVLNGYAITDKKGNGVVYASHIYPWKAEWEQKVGVAADKYPVLIGEVGCEPDPKQEDPKIWAPKVLEFIQKRRLNWTAWCFHTSASPRLLADWNYNPTPYWGALVKAALAGK